MENLLTKSLILIARFIIVGFFTFAYVTPLYILFYLIIFQNKELLSEISVKSYLISYFTGFVINYINAMNLLKKDEKPINKGF